MLLRALLLILASLGNGLSSDPLSEVLHNLEFFDDSFNEMTTKAVVVGDVRDEDLGPCTARGCLSLSDCTEMRNLGEERPAMLVFKEMKDWLACYEEWERLVQVPAVALASRDEDPKDMKFFLKETKLRFDSRVSRL